MPSLAIPEYLPLTLVLQPSQLRPHRMWTWHDILLAAGKEREKIWDRTGEDMGEKGNESESREGRVISFHLRRRVKCKFEKYLIIFHTFLWIFSVSQEKERGRVNSFIHPCLESALVSMVEGRRVNWSH